MTSTLPTVAAVHAALASFNEASNAVRVADRLIDRHRATWPSVEGTGDENEMTWTLISVGLWTARRIAEQVAGRAGDAYVASLGRCSLVDLAAA